MFLKAREEPSSGLSMEQIQNFFLFVGKSQQTAENFSRDYMFWGDSDGDGRLDRDGKSKIHFGISTFHTTPFKQQSTR